MYLKPGFDCSNFVEESEQAYFAYNYTLYTKSIHQYFFSPFSLLEIANFKSTCSLFHPIFVNFIT